MSVIDRIRERAATIRRHADDPALAADLARADREARERAAKPEALPQFLPPRRYRRFVDHREVFPRVADSPTAAILELAAERRNAGDCDGTLLQVWDGGDFGDTETLGWFARHFAARVEGATG